MRIVSCVPSLSELAEDLRPSCLVGRTRFCIAPASIREVMKIGGTKSLDIGRIMQLQPDLVLSVKEENEKEQIEYLINSGLQVEVFDINGLIDAIDMVQKMGVLLGNTERATGIRNGMEQLYHMEGFGDLSVLYFIWQQPFMVAGEQTFIGDLLRISGFKNLAPAGSRYPVLKDINEVRQLNPDLIFLSSEPFPFTDKHCFYFQNNLPDSKVYKVDGRIFSWYGKRPVQIPRYLQNLL